MSKVWNFQAKHYGMHGAERNFSHEGNGSGCHAGGGAGQQVHLRGGLLSFRRQDQCPRGLLSTCSLQAEGNCTTTVVHILLVRHFQAHRRVVVLLLARGVGRSPFPPWGLGGLLRRRRYSIPQSRKLISKRKSAAAAQDATNVGCELLQPSGSMTLVERRTEAHTRCPGHRGYIGGFGEQPSDEKGEGGTNKRRLMFLYFSNFISLGNHQLWPE